MSKTNGNDPAGRNTDEPGLANEVIMVAMAAVFAVIVMVCAASLLLVMGSL